MIDIYYVEDDENIAQTVADFLGQRGYRVSVFSTVAQAKHAFGNVCPTLALIDWNMPDGNGNMLCRWIRSVRRELPIIFLTVRGDSCDIVDGFRNGADDYVVKPFDTKESVARIKAVRRRSAASNSAAPEVKEVSYDKLTVNMTRYELKVDGKAVDTPPKELELLFHLASNPNRVYTRD
ncbi:MAG: response regulator transcription factor, partial [Acetatifactor sp.]|nr:response regulator transcription factor [Acetatifactor sp.]